MSSQFNFRTLIVCVMVFSLVMVGLIPIPIGRSQASNNSLPHSLTLSVNASSEKPGLQAKPFDEATRARVNETPGKSSLSFEENRGGMDRHVKYVSRGTGYTLFLTTTEAVVVWQNERQPLNPSDAQSAIGNRQSAHPKPMLLRMKLAGASRSPAVKGETQGGGRPNYAGGNDAEQRQPDVARYERVRYATVYPGIDVIYYGQQRQLAYDFVVAPGADARPLSLEFEGAHRVKVERATGDLMIEIGGVEVRQHKPVAYQEGGNGRQEVASRYVALSKNRVRIEVGEYDRARPLVINPVLSFSTYPSTNSQDSGATLSPNARTPDQDRKDQRVAKPTDFGDYSISGYVTDLYGYGLPDVLMVLEGLEVELAYTDDDGFYSFAVEAGGSYSVYPYSFYYTFAPDHYDFYNVYENQSADFAVDYGSFSISGYVTGSDGFGIEGVTVQNDGPETSYAYTDDDGYYSFDNLPGGFYYIVYAYKPFYLFVPDQYDFYDLRQDETADFSTPFATISGLVRTNDGAGVGGVSMTLSGNRDFPPRTITTASDGTYAFTGVPVGPLFYSYQIKPALTNYRFSPSEYFTDGSLYGDLPDVDFTAIPRTYAIIGVVRLGAARLPGVTVKLTSPTPAGFPPQTLTTNSGGAYAFDGLPPGRNYQVTAMMNGYQIGPAFQTINNLSANQTRVDFNVKINSITGRITRAGTTTGLGGVTVTLASPTPANFPDRTVRTDSTGKYSFKVLPTGRNYTIKPVKSGYTFSPQGRRITNLSTNIPAGATTNFTGTGP